MHDVTSRVELVGRDWLQQLCLREYSRLQKTGKKHFFHFFKFNVILFVYFILFYFSASAHLNKITIK